MFLRLLVLASLWLLVYSTSLSSHPADNTSGISRTTCSGLCWSLQVFKLTTSCNFTSLKKKKLREIQAPTTNLYLVAFVVGLPSNLLALWVLLFQTKPVPSTTLLVNLTAADCLLLLVLPFRIVYHFKGNHWDLGEPFCRVVIAMFYGNMYGSVLCLALVALDRYVALVHPFGTKMLRSQWSYLYMTAAVWAVMLATMLPLLVSQQTYVLEELQIATCHDAGPEEEQENYFLAYFTTLFSVCFILPFTAVLFCHGPVLRTLLAEGHNILLLLTYADSLLDGEGEVLYIPYIVSLAVSTFNSCIDPFIFYYMSAKFREKAKGVLIYQQGHLIVDRSSLSNNMSYCSSSLRSKITLLSKSTQRTSGMRSQLQFTYPTLPLD
uniref:F2R like thrombin or trypsin receptor 3 n=1 Tax=Echeneis naucrates TaxID=173247 RepID=A0A665TZJ3_ECHNA